MQVLVAATSSKVDDLILIETSTTIGDQTTSTRVGYQADELMDNRFLSGDLEHRIECLRIGAESMTVKAIEMHFKTIMKVLKKEPEVTDVSDVPSSQLQGLKADVLIPDGYGEVKDVVVLAAKKTRAKRQPKTTA